MSAAVTRDADDGRWEPFRWQSKWRARPRRWVLAATRSAACWNASGQLAAQLGIVWMAIALGAPVPLRRSLGAGGHRTFAPALQILVALLEAVSMPVRSTRCAASGLRLVLSR
jgi:hypothetical protein